MVGIERILASHSLVGLDTSVWIYHLEGNQRYLSLTTSILNSIQEDRQQGIGSVITIMEITVRPYRIKQPAVATHYEVMLSRFPNFRLIDVSQNIARRAAQLRGIYGLRAVDAIHVATSLVAGATAWLTNDRDLRRLSDLIDVIALDDFVTSVPE
jgi:predicted nucleic acid-binding protein